MSRNSTRKWCVYWILCKSLYKRMIYMSSRTLVYKTPRENVSVQWITKKNRWRWQVGVIANCEDLIALGFVRRKRSINFWAQEIQGEPTECHLRVFLLNFEKVNIPLLVLNLRGMLEYFRSGRIKTCLGVCMVKSFKLLSVDDLVSIFIQHFVC